MARLKSTENKTLFAADLAVNLRMVALVLLSVVIMITDHRSQRLEPVRNVLATLAYPLEYLIQLPILIGDRVNDLFTEQSQLLAELDNLKKKQLFINVQLQKLTALEAENRRLRALLESSANIREKVLIAELMTVDFDPYRHRILLNKGTTHGVYIGQPLLDERGVVGQIVHANRFTSTAILITDPNHALPVQINRNGLRTLAVGTGDFKTLELPHVPNNNDVRVGDLLITSGLGGLFPRGYPVAQVTRVEFDPGSPFAHITAQPTTDLDRIREVLLVVSEPAPDPDSMPVGPHKSP